MACEWSLSGATNPHNDGKIRQMGSFSGGELFWFEPPSCLLLLHIFLLKFDSVFS